MILFDIALIVVMNIIQYDAASKLDLLPILTYILNPYFLILVDFEHDGYQFTQQSAILQLLKIVLKVLDILVFLLCVILYAKWVHTHISLFLNVDAKALATCLLKAVIIFFLDIEHGVLHDHHM